MNNVMVIVDQIQGLLMLILSDYYQAEYALLEKTLQEKKLKQVYVLILNAFLSLILQGKTIATQNTVATPYAVIDEIYDVVCRFGYENTSTDFVQQVGELAHLGLIVTDEQEKRCYVPLNDYQVFSKAIQIIQDENEGE